MIAESEARVASLLGAIAIMAGGFALLGKTWLKLFLGPKLDGNGGAWSKLIKSVDRLSARMEAVEEKQDETVAELKKLAER